MTTQPAAHEAALKDAVFVLQGMALQVPETKDHPNKLPFTGVLTKIDEVSDKPPDGARGKRVVLTRAAAEAALPTLLGMPVDFTDGLDGHDVKKKIGVITEATIEGNDLHIAGFFYPFDFPAEVKKIRAMRDVLGFSWELANIYTPDVNSDPMIISGCVFTGAAVLRKDKAAYTHTSLAASSTKGDSEMTPEQIKEMLEGLASMKAMGETVSKIGTRLDALETGIKPMQAAAQHVSMVEPHAKALESCAAAMEKDGIGGHPTRGHVRACHAMAKHLRAEAAAGKLSSEWPGFEGDFGGHSAVRAAAETPEDKAAREAKDAEFKKLTDTVASMTTQIADMKAAAAKVATAPGAGGQPERKSLTPQITALLAKAGIATVDGKAMSVGEVDAAMSKVNLPSATKMEVKSALQRAGLLTT